VIARENLMIAVLAEGSDQPRSVEPLGPVRMRVGFYAKPPDGLPT